MTKHALFISLVILIAYSCVKRESNPRVLTVYPTSDTLPENLLRLYIQFSEPMKTTENLDKIKLLDERGQEVKGAIFNNVHELWDSDQKQLTILFDPARVKSDLQANKSMGRALAPGMTYELMITDLETIKHKKIMPYTKKIHVIAADTISPNTIKWNLNLPKADGTAPLNISFADRVDQMSLRQRLVIVDENENRIEGDIRIGNYEKEWSFIPNKNWKPGHYAVYVHARLEDPSGNNLNGLFDHRSGSLKYETEDEVLKLPFSIEE
ncbi:MAG: hypothetical protein AAF551_06955 [Bacteroidota bacterium]